MFKVWLPTTEIAFDSLVDQVVTKYKLKDRDHAAVVISVAIRHLPNEQATTTLKYLGHAVLKNLANHIANFKSEKISHEVQVKAYADKLRSDPGDTQAFDQLEKWANAGSVAAKDALASLDTKPKLTAVPEPVTCESV